MRISQGLISPMGAKLTLSERPKAPRIGRSHNSLFYAKVKWEGWRKMMRCELIVSIFVLFFTLSISLSAQAKDNTNGYSYINVNGEFFDRSTVEQYVKCTKVLELEFRLAPDQAKKNLVIRELLRFVSLGFRELEAKTIQSEWLSRNQDVYKGKSERELLDIFYKEAGSCSGLIEKLEE